MSHPKSARRRREIRKQQKERKRTNDARKAEAKLLAYVDEAVWWGAAAVGVSVPAGSDHNVIEWKDQSGNRLDLSKSK